MKNESIQAVGLGIIRIHDPPPNTIFQIVGNLNRKNQIKLVRFQIYNLQNITNINYFMNTKNFYNQDNTNNTSIPVFYSFMTKADLTEIIAMAVKEALEVKQGLEMAPTLNPNELLTREEAAKEFKVSIATIDNYRREGMIVPSRLKGTVRFKRADLQAAFSGSVLNPYKASKGKRS